MYLFLLLFIDFPRLCFDFVVLQGRRNSVIVGRKGFSELYMFSPGSGYEIYGEYAYVCVGQSAMLKPITVGPEQELRLGQDLYNPNL